MMDQLPAVAGGGTITVSLPTAPAVPALIAAAGDRAAL
jgi:hypothetical protein